MKDSKKINSKVEEDVEGEDELVDQEAARGHAEGAVEDEGEGAHRVTDVEGDAAGNYLTSKWIITGFMRKFYELQILGVTRNSVTAK